MALFKDRREAGLALGDALRSRLRQAEAVVVLAIPRGGVPVGVEVAGALGAHLDVVVVRKLRVPTHPELGFGAVASDGHVELDAEIVARAGVSRDDIAREVADRRAAVNRRLRAYREILGEPDLAGATVIVVDDGVATGGTAREACALARRMGAARVVLAVPVGPPDTGERMTGAADEVVVLAGPQDFRAVGQAYGDFTQLGDAEVDAMLRDAAERRPEG